MKLYKSNLETAATASTAISALARQLGRYLKAAESLTDSPDVGMFRSWREDVLICLIDDFFRDRDFASRCCCHYRCYRRRHEEAVAIADSCGGMGVHSHGAG